MKNEKKSFIDIREYRNAPFHLDLLGIKRELPLAQVEAELWIVVNEPLCFGCDIEFTETVGKKLAKRLAGFQPDILLTPETKAIAVAYEVTRHLRLSRFVLARKSKKAYVKDVLKTSISSITTPEPQELFLDKVEIPYIQGKRVVLFDDVLSTGKTLQGLKNLAIEAGAEICAIAVVWLEGFWAFEVFADEFWEGKVRFLDIFPLYAVGSTYQTFLREKERVEATELWRHILAQKPL